MILTTTALIEGHPIREYKGIVTGEVITGANFLKDIGAGLRDFFGGRAGGYEKTIIASKDQALEEMQQRARDMGANAIVGIDIDYETIGDTNTILMVAVSGTAVVI
ncbi:MAG: YbjQ family protein [Prevotella sp.]|nr:YbjQ family protein [Prevotella sp.]